ncbi:hypothetical protein DFH11DRAFT_1801866 [Phellopilus nigrolimitatus]|nr:hypothetical protein DFH11DRAFT_1801866 [Phellopilus nigrolimitatus]
MSTSPVPVIEISPAPHEAPQPEPFSPFTPLNAGFGAAADDAYRPSLLSPPVSCWTPAHHRPRAAAGRGIRDEDFQALLRASKKQDLRREVALRAHKTKQMERRALFLSKIGAPPSPTATATPKTPPDSPAIFHYSLPSPGLDSPLALFERLGLGPGAGAHDPDAARTVWVEQVDFRRAAKRAAPPPPQAETPEIEMPAQTQTQTPPAVRPRRAGHARKSSLPSLAQITERFSAQAAPATPPPPSPATPSPATPARARAPLPAFLSARRQSPPPEDVPTIVLTRSDTAAASNPASARPRLACTGRIRFPTRPPSPLEPPATPVSPRSPATLQVTTTHVPRSAAAAPAHPAAPLTAANLCALGPRARTARDMLCAVRRRTAASSGGASGKWTLGGEGGEGEGEGGAEDEKARRRISAPAELPARARGGFAHPVLALPGGF